MANISFQAPTDYSVEAADIDRRRRYAELLQQQSMEGVPLPQTPAGGFTPNISWTQGLAKMLQGYAGRKGLDEATARSRALAERFRTEGQDTLQRGMQAYQGTPGQTIPEAPLDPEAAGRGDMQGAPVQMPAQPGNPAAAMAIMGGHPMTQGYSGALMAQMLKAQDPYTLAPGAVRMGPGNAPVAAAPFKPELPKEHVVNGTVYRSGPNGVTPLGGPGEGTWGEPYPLNGASVQRNALTGQVRQAVSREPNVHVSVPPPITSVTIKDPSDPTGNNTIVVDGRTGRKIGDGPKLSATGVAEQKLQLGLPQAKLRVESMGQNLDRLDAALNALHDDKGVTNITGTIMGRTPNITNTATGAQAQLNSIKSQIFQSSLQAMREASKTGGAVGNVSDKEGDKLERTIAALDQAQGTPDFKKQLKKAVDQVRQSKALIDVAFQEQYGGVQGRNAGAERGSSTLNADEQKELEALRARFGR